MEQLAQEKFYNKDRYRVFSFRTLELLHAPANGYRQEPETIELFHAPANSQAIN